MNSMAGLRTFVCCYSQSLRCRLEQSGRRAELQIQWKTTLLFSVREGAPEHREVLGPAPALRCKSQVPRLWKLLAQRAERLEVLLRRTNCDNQTFVLGTSTTEAHPQSAHQRAPGGPARNDRSVKRELHFLCLFGLIQHGAEHVFLRVACGVTGAATSVPADRASSPCGGRSSDTPTFRRDQRQSNHTCTTFSQMSKRDLALGCVHCGT